MCAFSYVWWSLLVTWQRQRLQLHHSIRCTWKPCKHHSSMFGIADRSFTLQEQELSTFLAPATLTLTQWPLYKNSTRSPWRYTACVNMNFIRQGFRKLSLDRHTYRPTYMTNIISDAAWRVVNNVGGLFTQSAAQEYLLGTWCWWRREFCCCRCRQFALLGSVHAVKHWRTFAVTRRHFARVAGHLPSSPSH